MARFYQPKKKTTIDTKHQAVLVERLDHQGAGIAFKGKKPIFIDGALPEEEVLIQIVESKSKFSRANLIKVLSPNSERIDAFCPHYSDCGGCNMQHLSREAQIEYKQTSLKQLVKKFSGEEQELVAPIVGEPLGYRRRARISLHVDKRSGELQFGFRRKQSKQIVSITHCPAMSEKLDSLLPELKTLLSSFSELRSLGHLELVEGDEQPVIMLRVIKPLPEHEQQQLIEFAQQRGITCYLLAGEQELILLHGSDAVYSEIGSQISFLPTNFIQVNREVNEKMVVQALEWLELTPTDRVLDLYCGLGNFSLPMAKKASYVVGVEGIQSMVDQATKNALSNDIDNVAFYQANLEEAISDKIWASDKFDKVLLDPARAGASGVVDQLSQLGVNRVVYVSCNPATLARDCQSILEQGFKLTRLGMLDMFPHTSHLESMALFQR